MDILPVKLSTFHKQVLLAWSLIYKHNFSPHRYLIWNNRDILDKNSLFFESWEQNQNLLVGQLPNGEVQLFSYRDFLSTEYSNYTTRICNCHAIPSGSIMLFTNIGRPPPTFVVGSFCILAKLTQICHWPNYLKTLPYCVRMWYFAFIEVKVKKRWTSL